MYLRGAAYRPESRDRHLTVALIDRSGKVLCSTLANEPCSHKDLPPDCGFAIPLPLAWLCDPEDEIRFSFRIMETGTEFPVGGRTLEKSVLTRMVALEAKVAEAHAGAKRLGQALAAVPPGKKPFLVAVHELSRSGAPLIALSLAKALCERTGWHAITLCLEPEGTLSDEFARMGQVVSGLGPLLNENPQIAVRELAQLRKISHPSALVNSLCSAPLAGALHQAGFQVLSLVHEYPFAFPQQHVEVIMRVSAELVFPCDDVRQHFAAALKTNGCRTSVIPQGAYVAEVGDAGDVRGETGESLRGILAIGTGEKVILACASVDARKGFDWFSSFALHFGRSSPMAGLTHFVWVGKVYDTSLFFHAMHTIKVNGMAARFHHVDEMEDLSGAYAAADLLLMCSRIDPFPNVVLEAMAAGLPIVGFDQGQGTSALIRETGLGAVVRAMDMEETRLAVERILSDHELRARAALEGPKIIRSRFGMREYCAAIAGRLTALGNSPP